MARDGNLAEILAAAKAQRNRAGPQSASVSTQSTGTRAEASVPDISSPPTGLPSNSKRQRVEAEGVGSSRAHGGPGKGKGVMTAPPAAAQDLSASEGEVHRYLDNVGLKVSGLLPTEVSQDYSRLSPVAMAGYVKKWSVVTASVLKYLEAEVLPQATVAIGEKAALEAKVEDLHKSKEEAARKAREEIQSLGQQKAEAARLAAEKEADLVALRADLTTARAKAEELEKSLADKQEELEAEQAAKAVVQDALVDMADFAWNKAVAQVRLGHPGIDLSWMNPDADVVDGELQLEVDGQLVKPWFPGCGR